MKFTRREDTRFELDKVRLPLVALIDVVLFLLMYFVIAGTLAAEESQLAASLKTDGKSGRSSDLVPLVLNVEPGGSYRLGERLVGDQASLAVLLKQLPKDQGVVVRVNGAASVEQAAAALQAAHDAGFDKVSYVPAK